MSADWIEVGAPVAIVEIGGRVQHVTEIERLTKTRIVLKGGEWFNREFPEKRRGQWSPTLRLVDATEPDVVRQIRLQQAAQIAFELEKAVRSLSQTSSDQERADVGRTALRLARKLGAA